MALTHDCAAAVERSIRAQQLPVLRLLVLGAADGPGLAAVPGADWLVEWCQQVREEVREAAADLGARTVQLFFACPAAAALFLGHYWNVMPPTRICEFDKADYHRTFTLTGVSSLGDQQ